MNRRLTLWTGLGVLLITRVASAQDVTIGYQGLPYKSSGESNTGIQLSDGVLMHVGIGVEAGYDTNVFYQDTDTHQSAIIVVAPYAEVTNASRTGPVSSLLSFDARVGLQYRRYQSDDPAITPFRNAWMPNAGLSLSTGGGTQFGFGVADAFARIEDAPYTPGQQPIQRDNNQASIEGRWSPGGGRLSATLRYTNMIDYFQDPTFSYANSVSNFITADASWRWLPKTAVFVDVKQGYITYLNTGSANTEGKYSSFPLYVTAGLRGLLTSVTTVSLTLGYQNGFYSGGATTNGYWGSTYADLMFSVRVSDLSRAVVGYRHDFENSVIANFSLNDTVYASYVQEIFGRLALDLSGRYTHVNYQGFVDTPGHVAERTDNVYNVGASLDYFMRNWAYLGVGYSFLADRSDYSLNGDSASYTKQQIFGRLGITY
jgi:hypothetical protein